jgi:hypothetical protein
VRFVSPEELEPKSEPEVIDLCSAFGEVLSVEAEGGRTFLVRYASHEAAEAALGGWAKESNPLATESVGEIYSTWNDKPYDASGWCTFETGAAMLAAGHRGARLEKSQAYRGLANQLPAKLIDIGGPLIQRVEVTGPPDVRELEAAIAAARFTGDADRQEVVGMLRQFNTLLEMQSLESESTPWGLIRMRDVHVDKDVDAASLMWMV